MQYGGYEVLGRKEHQWSGNSNEKKEVTVAPWAKGEKIMTTLEG